MASGCFIVNEIERLMMTCVAEFDARDSPVLCVRRQLVPVSAILPQVSCRCPTRYGLCRDHQDHRGQAGNQKERTWKVPGDFLTFLHFDISFSLLLVRVLWDQEEVRLCQGEAGDWREGDHGAHTGAGGSLHRLPGRLSSQVQPCTTHCQVCTPPVHFLMLKRSSHCQIPQLSTSI